MPSTVDGHVRISDGAVYPPEALHRRPDKLLDAIARGRVRPDGDSVPIGLPNNLHHGLGPFNVRVKVDRDIPAPLASKRAMPAPIPPRNRSRGRPRAVPPQHV